MSIKLIKGNEELTFQYKNLYNNDLPDYSLYSNTYGLIEPKFGRRFNKLKAMELICRSLSMISVPFHYYFKLVKSKVSFNCFIFFFFAAKKKTVNLIIFLLFFIQVVLREWRIQGFSFSKRRWILRCKCFC